MWEYLLSFGVMAQEPMFGFNNCNDILQLMYFYTIAQFSMNTNIQLSHIYHLIWNTIVKLCPTEEINWAPNYFNSFQFQTSNRIVNNSTCYTNLNDLAMALLNSECNLGNHKYGLKSKFTFMSLMLWMYKLSSKVTRSLWNEQFWLVTIVSHEI